MQQCIHERPLVSLLWQWPIEIFIYLFYLSIYLFTYESIYQCICIIFYTLKYLNEFVLGRLYMFCLLKYILIIIADYVLPEPSAFCTVYVHNWGEMHPSLLFKLVYVFNHIKCEKEL